MNRDEAAAWVIGAVGVFGSALGWVFAPARFHYAWLAALFVWLGWPLGSMAGLFVHALTGGQWGTAIRPALLAGVCTTPLLLPAIVPYILSAHALYPWLDPRVSATLPNRFYLNAPFLAGRGGVYVVAWLVLAALIAFALRRAAPAIVLARLAPPGLIILSVTVTFAVIDLTLAQDPRFLSSAYGMITAASFGLFALAIAAMASAPLIDDREVLADVAKLMLALVLLWAYLEFMQVLIIWESDLANESPWYIARTSHGWGAVAVAIAVCHFALPFLLLLSPGVQRSRFWVSSIAAMLIAIEIVRGWWLVLPYVHLGVGPVDVMAMLAMGGLAGGVALRAGRAFLHPMARHG